MAATCILWSFGAPLVHVLRNERKVSVCCNTNVNRGGSTAHVRLCPQMNTKTNVMSQIAHLCTTLDRH